MRFVMLIRVPVLVFLTALCVVPLPLAHAARIQSLDAELLAESDLVVEGIVREQTPHWNEDGSLIFTTVTLDIVQTLYSASAGSPRSLQLEVPGGEIGDIGLLVEGMPRFCDGERAVVFIARWTKGRNVVAGGEAGWIPVDPDGFLSGRAVSVDRFGEHLRTLSR